MPAKPQPVDVVHIDARVFKIVIAAIVTILGSIGGYFVLADRIDNHWLTTDKAKVKFQAIDRNTAWILFSVQDFKAAAADKWAEDCRAQRKPGDCRHLDDQAAQFKAEALDLKKSAAAQSKGD